MFKIYRHYKDKSVYLYMGRIFMDGKVNVFAILQVVLKALFYFTGTSRRY